ncbi:hypothetical protein EKN06_09420 [Croceicoccus ponticola]|uniref:PilZ domain-containing protein n=1 Tax=Croceicoccus ponticola TaxID=2217664 RepID=A0A437GXM5_9SPHN|nr:hypothetical protein EKN06_09420 [Croceicoccus ponticola]
MTYKPLSELDTRTRHRWRGMAFARIQSGAYVGRCVSVVEFSETGCRVRDHTMACEEGDMFHLVLEDVGPMVADVRWTYGAFIGASFRQPLTALVMEHLHTRLDQPLQMRMAQMMNR